MKENEHPLRPQFDSGLMERVGRLERRFRNTVIISATIIVAFIASHLTAVLGTNDSPLEPEPLLCPMQTVQLSSNTLMLHSSNEPLRTMIGREGDRFEGWAYHGYIKTTHILTPQLAVETNYACTCRPETMQTIPIQDFDAMVPPPPGGIAHIH